MKAKVIKRQSGSYIRLPEELRGESEVELHTLRDGFYLLSVPLGGGSKGAEAANSGGGEAHAPAEGAGDSDAARAPAGNAASGAVGPPPAAGPGLDAQEGALLRKLISIPFGKRVPSHLAKVLTEGEKEALNGLKKKGAVSFFRSDKYKEGVFNISKKFYGNMGREAPAGPSEMEKQLFRDGYLVITDRRVAQDLSEKLSRQRFTIAGVKAFDGKYYIATKAFLGKVNGLLAKAGPEVEPRMLVEKFGGEPMGYAAALKILAESGEYAEEKGGIFVKVD